MSFQTNAVLVIGLLLGHRVWGGDLALAIN